MEKRVEEESEAIWDDVVFEDDVVFDSVEPAAESVTSSSIWGRVAKYGTAATMVAGAGLVAFAVNRYRVSSPSQYLVRTGAFIKDVDISKKAFQWPFQTATFISLRPYDYEFRLHAMSQEWMEFVLPGVFTIGPKDDLVTLKRFATLLSGKSLERIDDIVKGVIEGETRVLAATMTLDDIASNREVFKRSIIESIQDELKQFGLMVYNANIKELEDAEGSEYFIYRRQRLRSAAENQARRDIAEAQYRGDTGVKERERDTRVLAAEYESEAVQNENRRNIEVAESTAAYKIKQAEFNRATQLAEIEADKAAHVLEAELQAQVEKRNISTETEKLRSSLFARAAVEAESKERAADAQLYSAQREAEGILAKYNAQAEGLRKLMGATDNPDDVLRYMMIDKDVYQKLAEQSAKAIQGLEPKITHWVTDNGGGNSSNPIADLMRHIPPLVDTIHKQTGILPPDWMLNTNALRNDVTAVTKKD